MSKLKAPESFTRKVNVLKVMAEKTDKAMIENWIANECFLIKGEVEEVVAEYFNSQLLEVDPKEKRVDPKKLTVAMEAMGLDEHALPIVTRLWTLLLRLDDFSEPHRLASLSEFPSCFSEAERELLSKKHRWALPQRTPWIHPPRPNLKSSVPAVGMPRKRQDEILARAVDYRALKLSWFEQWLEKRVVAVKGEADEVAYKIKVLFCAMNHCTLH